MSSDDRKWSIEKLSSAEALADALTQFSWRPSQGFQLDRLIFLHQTQEEDAEQSYKVLYQAENSCWELGTLQLLNVSSADHFDEVLEEIVEFLDEAQTIKRAGYTSNYLISNPHLDYSH